MLLEATARHASKINNHRNANFLLNRRFYFSSIKGTMGFKFFHLAFVAIAKKLTFTIFLDNGLLTHL